MPVTMLARRRLASAVLPAVAGLVMAGLGALPSAQAAAAGPARVAAHLHTTGTVSLGKPGKLFNFEFSEGPNGAVYYSQGSAVYVVKGTSSPALFVHASGNVLAVTANSTEVFAEVGRTVTGYSLSGAKVLRHWKLASKPPLTSAGLYAVGGTVWSWTDWATDFSGFEFANVNEFSTSSSTVHRISTANAYPADMFANSAGLYYEAARKNGTNGYLVHVTPSLVPHRTTDVNLDAPLALAGGRVDLLAVHGNGHSYLDSYSAASLVRKFSKRVSDSDRDIAGTGAGLLLLTEPCQVAVCSSAKVSQLSPASGTPTATITVPDALILVPGPSAAVITVTKGKLYLVRLAA